MITVEVYSSCGLTRDLYNSSLVFAGANLILTFFVVETVCD